jgi:tetratricopeptide (TPR) repeat protein
LCNQEWIADNYHQLGILAQVQGDYEEAELLYQQSLRINEQLDNQARVASGYHQLGVLAQNRVDYGQAEQRYQQSLQINERLSNQAEMATNYGQMGNLAQVRGDYEEAERRYQQSLQIVERLGDQAGMAISWSQLGNLAMERRQYSEATVWIIRALIMGLRLQVLQTTYDAHALGTLRAHMGNDAFVAAANTVVDEARLAKIQAILDSLGSGYSGESEAE